MGGGAFPNLHTPRMLPPEYSKLRDKYIGILLRFYDKVVCSHESPGKVDHGDVDLIVSGPFPDFSSSRLSRALGAVEQTKAATLTSFAVPFDREGEILYAQVDILLCAEDCLDWEIWMGAYGDLSQIIRVLAQTFGLTMTNKGLWIEVPEAKGSNQEAAKLFLTKDPVEARRFLGLDEEHYQKGFKTVEEMFCWSSKGKYLQVPATQIKAKKRQVFNDFRNSTIHNRDLWPSKVRESQEDVLKLAIATFGVQEQYRLLIERPRKFNEIVAAVGDPRKRSIPRSFKRWIGFQEDGSPILLPVDQRNGHAGSNQDAWLDKVREDRLPQFLAWIEANRTEIERKETVWIARKSLDKNLAHLLDQLPQTGDHDFELSRLNFNRFDKELGLCHILGSACQDENLLRRCNSCEEIFSEYRVHSHQTFPLGSDPQMVKTFHSIWAETENVLFSLRGSIDRSIFSACLDLTLSLKDNLGFLLDRVDQTGEKRSEAVGKDPGSAS